LPVSAIEGIFLHDSGGNIQTSYTYDPFGNISVTGTSNGNEFQYTGRENEGNCLYFYRARYYSSLLGRFVNEDPLGFAAGDINLYTYVLGDPINFIDQSGESAARPLPNLTPGSGWRLIPGGAGATKFLPEGIAEWGVAGFLTGFDIFVGYEDLEAIHDFNAENAAYDAELQAIHNLNQVLLTRPRPVPPLAGRYTPDQQRQREYERARDTCNAAVPDSGNLCSNLSRQIDHTKRCISLYESWDDRWAPGRHASEIATWQQSLSNLKRDHNDNCTDN
jgi:RHS repeat-associated protein